MADTVKIIIDDVEYEVPTGMNLVDAAKWHADNDIPVFCYHPKMAPVGMCRMCLVEMGTVEKDRESGAVIMEGGKPKVRWMPKLQTACTQRVSDGLVIRTATKAVTEARNNVLEFLLTSHPLDCPICDKGGECPLQNLTMAHGPGKSRMYFDDKMHLDKHVPLGDLIYLDEERCIQCARCIRFQEEVAGDDVLAFHERGRRLQIITHSDPPFDTYFSGNTTDICPVGALTTADFRFGARPWELTEVPSISPHDASGENISLSTRLDRDFGGKAIIKRVMPRQNEAVNEIWISDKARFVHHFTRSAERLLRPMVKQGGELRVTDWATANSGIIKALQNAGDDVAVIVGGSISNEDGWELRQLLVGKAGARFGVWPPTHGGGDILAQVGVGSGSNLGALGKGDAILVIASDLEEEVPIWHLRVKQAQDRGAYLVVANARHTRLEEFATQPVRYDKVMNGDAIRYDIGMAAHTMANLRQDHPDIADKLAKANNLVVIAGAEGLTLEGSQALMAAIGNFLIETGHYGKANNGLMWTAPGANSTGLHYLGYTPQATQDIAANPPRVLLVAQAEILNDDPTAAEWLSRVETVICFSLFPDALAQRATYALPIQSFAERDGTFTNGERRVQRFYTAQGPMGESLPLWQAIARLREALGGGRAKVSAAAVMLELSEQVPAFAGMRYKELSKVERQFPDVGGENLYYGGTAYQNRGGLGRQIPATSEQTPPQKYTVDLPKAPKASKENVIIAPITRLYTVDSISRPSRLLHNRVAKPFVMVAPSTAKKLGVAAGDAVTVTADGSTTRAAVVIDESAAEGVVFLPRHLTLTPTPLRLTVGTIAKAREAALQS